MDRRNTDMKNKIKKILLLGMTAMFTAGAAGTAVISCPVWADEAEQNSETAEEPKAEDAAVEEEIADQTDDKTENTDLQKEVILNEKHYVLQLQRSYRRTSSGFPS